MNIRPGSVATSLVTAIAFSLAAAWAAEEPALEVGGRVAGETTTLSRTQLEALGMTAVVTHTPWDDGVVTYEGVALADLMHAVGAEGTHAHVIALNHYSSVVPLSDFERHGPILATRRNGAHMPVSDKGPFFIVYPFDERPELNGELYWSRSVWQVTRIMIE